MKMSITTKTNMSPLSCVKTMVSVITTVINDVVNNSSTIKVKSTINNPLVSIITIVLNGEKYLEEMILSVLNQSYSNIELIIIDGGSTDKTPDIIRKYESNINYWLSEPDNGLSDAMNKGVKFAKGDLILHLHADDALCREDSIELLIKKLKHTDCQWVTAYNQYTDSQSNIIKRDNRVQYSKFYMMIRNVIRHQATLVPKAVFESIQFNPKYKAAMDYAFFLDVWDLLGDPAFCLEYTTNFRLDGYNISSNYLFSLKDEMAVRIQYRFKTNGWLFLPLDLTIFIARWLKVFFYHAKKQQAKSNA